MKRRTLNYKTRGTSLLKEIKNRNVDNLNPNSFITKIRAKIAKVYLMGRAVIDKDNTSITLINTERKKEIKIGIYKSKI